MSSKGKSKSINKNKGKGGKSKSESSGKSSGKSRVKKSGLTASAFGTINGLAGFNMQSEHITNIQKKFAEEAIIRNIAEHAIKITLKNEKMTTDTMIKSYLAAFKSSYNENLALNTNNNKLEIFPKSEIIKKSKKKDAEEDEDEDQDQDMDRKSKGKGKSSSNSRKGQESDNEEGSQSEQESNNEEASESEASTAKANKKQKHSSSK